MAELADASSRDLLVTAVLAGGRSSEHDVSLSSGAAVRDGLSAAGHEVVWVEIGRDGVWRHDGEPISVTPAGGLLGVDVVFPVLHGPFGEDGTVQGLLETLDVAYVGAGVAASALCLDKVLFKQLMSALSVPQVDYVGVRAQRFERAPEETLAELVRLGLPVFVKPAHLGSSVGIVKVSRQEELPDALQEAFSHDGLVIVEATATGKEVECGVLGVPDEQRETDGEAFVSRAGEIVFAGEFYDFGAKYTPGGMELRIPASISERAAERVRELALQAYLASGCEGRRAGAAERAEHDARLHADERLREAAGRLRRPLPDARGSPLPARAGAPGATAGPQLLRDGACALGEERQLGERR
jgi:D-alanine-D-alanine ligase